MKRHSKASRHVLGLATLAALAGAASGCVSHSTGETEVGVLVCKIGLGCAHKGVQEQLYPPGSTNVFAPFIRDFYTFDTKVQNLEMTASSKNGDRATRDDLQFKTTDGNDIAMDVTVAWTIDDNAKLDSGAILHRCQRKIPFRPRRDQHASFTVTQDISEFLYRQE